MGGGEGGRSARLLTREDNGLVSLQARAVTFYLFALSGTVITLGIRKHTMWI